MAEEALARAGLYLDEVHKLRVLNPDSGQASAELRQECKEFVDKVGQFGDLVSGQIGVVSGLSKQVQAAKMAALSSANQIKSLSKQREQDEQQLQALIREKQAELERLRLEHDALLRQEADLRDNLQTFLAPM